MQISGMECFPNNRAWPGSSPPPEKAYLQDEAGLRHLAGIWDDSPQIGRDAPTVDASVWNRWHVLTDGVVSPVPRCRWVRLQSEAGIWDYSPQIGWNAPAVDARERLIFLHRDGLMLPLTGADHRHGEYGQGHNQPNYYQSFVFHCDLLVCDRF
jgi:hypothetical protein